MEALLQLDTDLFLYLNGLGSTTWDGFWMFVTGKWNAIPIYIILFILMYKKLGVKSTVISLVVIALMILITDRVCTFFKFDLILRQRPCYNLESEVRLVKDWCGSKGGYFSAHAASSMALATFVGQLLKSYFKYIVVLLFIWALMVGYSRIYIGVHYPGDVLTGVVFGITVALVMVKLNRYLVLRFLK